MKKVVIYFLSVDGHTFKICQFIQKKLQDQRVDVSIYHILEHSHIEVFDADVILVGASVRYGNYQRALYQFIQNNLYQLSQHKSAFFSVNATARKEGRDRAETDHYFKKLKTKTGWMPNIAQIFAGAIHYPQYRFFDRLMIQWIMGMTQGPTDTSKHFEFTDWNKVDAFANRLLDM